MRKNIYQMYIENDFKFGFFVRRDSWSAEKYAEVKYIEGVEEGKPIEGEPPYFNRRFPADHPKAGKVWKRFVHLTAPWFHNEVYETDCGGNYSWTKVDISVVDENCNLR